MTYQKSDNIKIINIDIDYKKPFEISRKENSKFIKKALFILINLL